MVNVVSAYVEKAGVTYTAVHVQGAATWPLNAGARVSNGLCMYLASARTRHRTLRIFGPAARRAGSPANVPRGDDHPPECHVRSG